MERVKRYLRILIGTVFVFFLLVNFGFCQNDTAEGGQDKEQNEPDKRMVAQTVYQKGIKEAEKGDWDVAIRTYSIAIQTDPEFAPAYLKRAQAYHQLKRDKEAKIDLVKYLKLNPKDTNNSEVKALLSAIASEKSNQEENPTHKVEATTATSLSAKDSSFLVTAGNDGSIIVWDTSDWSQKNFISAHRKGIRAAALSRDNKYLATSGKKDRTLKIWEIDSGSPVKEIKMKKSVNSIDFSPDGRSIAVLTSNHIVTIMDTREWRVKSFFELPKSKSIIFSPDSEQIISMRKSRQIDIYSIDGGMWIGVILTNINKEQRDISLSPDGRLACSGRKLVQIIDVRTRGATEVYNIQGKGRAVAFSPDGRYLVCGVDKEIVVWELLGAKHQSVLLGHRGDVIDLCFSKTGGFLASASKDKTVKVWKVDTGELITTLRPGDKGVQSLMFSH